MTEIKNMATSVWAAAFVVIMACSISAALYMTTSEKLYATQLENAALMAKIEKMNMPALTSELKQIRANATILNNFLKNSTWEYPEREFSVYNVACYRKEDGETWKLWSNLSYEGMSAKRSWCENNNFTLSVTPSHNAQVLIKRTNGD